MRIGIDGRELLGQPTGVGRYLAALCSEWLNNPDHGHHLLVYTPAGGGNQDQLGPVFTDRPPSDLTHRAVGTGSGIWWEQTQLPWIADRDSLDVFFAPAYSAPLLLRVPCVVTMHDVSFAAHPEWYRMKEGLRRRWLAQHAMARASRVLTVSQFSKSEIVRLFDVAPDRIEVVYHGMARRLADGGDDRREPLVLYTGSIFNRRHLPTLIRAFNLVVSAVPDAELVVVGSDRSFPAQDLSSLASQVGVADRVLVQPYAPDDILEGLYRRAAVFVFLSEYEGFGLPPLEALSAGVPVVLGDTPVAHEVFGDAALYVDPLDHIATAKAVIALLAERNGSARRSLRERQIAYATDLLPRFSWPRAAADTMAVLEAAASSTER